VYFAVTPICTELLGTLFLELTSVLLMLDHNVLVMSLRYASSSSDDAGL
jgi:hypothetical protein